jgi:type II secretory pathway pseudopilin PulG
MNTALTGVTPGDWLAVGVGVLFGIIATVAAIAVPKWQRRVQLGDRARDRAERRAEEQRRARRESRQHQYLETNEILRLAQQIEWHVRNDGPFTEAGLEDLRLSKLVMDAEQLAARCPERLREPLDRLADAAAELRKTAVPSPAARSSVGSATTDAAATHADFRLAIRQDRAAHELAAVITTGWNALKEEWGN